MREEEMGKKIGVCRIRGDRRGRRRRMEVEGGEVEGGRKGERQIEVGLNRGGGQRRGEEESRSSAHYSCCDGGHSKGHPLIVHSMSMVNTHGLTARIHNGFSLLQQLLDKT